MTVKYEKAPGQAGLKEILLAILASAMIIIFLVAALFVFDINNPRHLFHEEMASVLLPAASPSSAPAVLESPLPEQTPSTIEEPLFEGNILNILLLGLDASTERYVSMGSFRTDTMMLLAINFDENKVDIISIPRDSYAEVPVPEDMQDIYHAEIKKTKVNEAFTIGGGFDGHGFDNTVDAVSALLGNLRIDYYMAFDMNVVKDVIDIMGGLYYDVDINVSINGRYVHEGYQLLSGQQVLDYSRVRKGYGGDKMRTDRQQRIVLQAVRQMKENNQLANIPEYYKAVSENVYTDLSIKQITALALYANSLDLENDIERHALSTVYFTQYGKSMERVIEEDKIRLLQEVYGIAETESSK